MILFYQRSYNVNWPSPRKALPLLQSDIIVVFARVDEDQTENNQPRKERS